MVHLYIKIHNKTGLKYFGKTTCDPFSYKGSGTHWKNHLTKHGEDVNTIVIRSSHKPTSEFQSFALEFSKINNIVESKEWANKIPENGLDGFPPGGKRSQKTKKKISKSVRNTWNNKSTKEKKSWHVALLEGKKINKHKQWYTPIMIYNSEDVLMFETKCNFIEVCKINNLPTYTLKESYQADGRKIYQNPDRNTKRLHENGMIQYRGWYAKKGKRKQHGKI